MTEQKIMEINKISKQCLSDIGYYLTDKKEYEHHKDGEFGPSILQSLEKYKSAFENVLLNIENYNFDELRKYMLLASAYHLLKEYETSNVYYEKIMEYYEINNDMEEFMDKAIRENDLSDMALIYRDVIKRHLPDDIKIEFWTYYSID